MVPLLLPDEKYMLFETFGLPSVPVFGRFGHSLNDMKHVIDIVVSLNKLYGEDIVIKSAVRRGHYLKYITPNINLLDIESDAILMPELEGGFFTSRLLRYAISAEELGVRSEEEKRFGIILLKGMRSAVKQYIERGYILKPFSIYLTDKKNVKEFIRLFNCISRHVKIDNIQISRKNGEYLVSFEKIYLDSNKRL